MKIHKDLTMLVVWKVFFVVLLATQIEGLTVLKNATGYIESHVVGSKSDGFKIITEKGKKIFLLITELTLNDESTLYVRDGKYGEPIVFKSLRGWLQRTQDSNTRSARVPITIITETRKLHIAYYADGASVEEGFSANYTTFNEETTCAKPESYVNATIDCDTDALSPVASQCQVTYDCGENYRQNNQTITCRADVGEWIGDVTCQPRAELVDECTFDYDELQIENCIYNEEELITFFENNLPSDDLDPNLSRGALSKMKCGKLCARHKKTRKFSQCPRGKRHKCYLCRFKLKCKRQGNGPYFG